MTLPAAALAPPPQCGISIVVAARRTGVRLISISATGRCQMFGAMMFERPADVSTRPKSPRNCHRVHGSRPPSATTVRPMPMKLVKVRTKTRARPRKARRLFGLSALLVIAAPFHREKPHPGGAADASGGNGGYPCSSLSKASRQRLKASSLALSDMMPSNLGLTLNCAQSRSLEWSDA